MQQRPDSPEPAESDQPPGGAAAGATADQLARAIALHQAGHLKEALDLYQVVLDNHPDHPVALNLGGVAASQLGDAGRGLGMLRKAAALNPGDAKIHNNLGTVLQSLGRVEEAATAFERALVITPDDADLLLNLGNALMAIGERDGALAALRHATECAPEDPAVHNTLGALLTDLGRAEEAEAACRHALKLKPGNADAEVNLGNALRASGRLDEAVAAYRRATALSPDDARVHGNLGLALKDLGRLDEAKAACERALAIAPDHPGALSNLGIILKEQGRFQEAVASHQRAVAIDPRNPSFQTNLGNALQALGKPAEAIAAHRRAVAIDPRNPSFQTNLGNALQALGRPTEAVAAHRQAVALKPGQAELHSNLGMALKDQENLDEALGCFRRAVAMAPDHAMLHYNLGTACLEGGDPEEAIAACDDALALDPDYPNAHWNRGLALLTTGRFRVGWAEYEWRWRTTDFPSRRRDFTQPLWDGSSLQGRTILLHTEQGLGDAIQFIRYVPQVAASGGRIVVECQPALVRLFQSISGIDDLVAKGHDLPPFDVHAPLLSLPHIFGTDMETIPAAVPYLSAPAGRRINPGHDDGLKVGLVWAGRPTHQNDRNRSIDLGVFKALLEVKGCVFFSLQVGDRRDDIEREGVRGRLIDLGAELNDFADTAAALAQLDLLIAVDTSVVHLAGALGRPVWTLLPFAADWRWLLARDDSPWYPTMRLFRQGRRGDWPGVLADVGEHLQALADAHPPSTPR